MFFLHSGQRLGWSNPIRSYFLWSFAENSKSVSHWMQVMVVLSMVLPFWIYNEKNNFIWDRSNDHAKFMFMAFHYKNVTPVFDSVILKQDLWVPILWVLKNSLFLKYNWKNWWHIINISAKNNFYLLYKRFLILSLSANWFIFQYKYEMASILHQLNQYLDYLINPL